jgi:hypothetical protein
MGYLAGASLKSHKIKTFLIILSSAHSIMFSHRMNIYRYKSFTPGWLETAHFHWRIRIGMIVGLLAQSFICSADTNARTISSVKRFVAIDNVCAWPNLTLLKDGTIIATIFNQPSHGRMEGDVECWASADGEFWQKRGAAAVHDAAANRMNVAAGLARSGKLVVLASGWSLKKNTNGATRLDKVLPGCSSRSVDGRAWTIRQEAFPEAEKDFSHYIPFGKLFPAKDGSLRSIAYAVAAKTEQSRVWMMRSDDDGVTWKRHSLIVDQHNETALLPLGETKWIVAARRDGSLSQLGLDCFHSDDDGRTWRADARIDSEGQGPADFTRLADGRLLLTSGNRNPGQYGVSARFSADDGITWSPPISIVADLLSGDCGYPSSVQRGDGSIITAYYAASAPDHRRYHMGAAIWNPPFGRGSSAATGESVWQFVRSQGGKTELPQSSKSDVDGLEVRIGETQTIVPGGSYMSLFKFNDGSIVVGGKRSSDAGKTWQNAPGFHVGAFQFPDGEVVQLGFKTKKANRDDYFSADLTRSTDNGLILKTETTTMHIPEATGGSGDDGSRFEGPVADHAIVQLRDGSLMAAMYGQFKTDRVPVPTMPAKWGCFKYRTFVMRSTDRGRTWDYLATVAYDPSVGLESFCEPDLLIVPDGGILCFMRTGGSGGKFTPLYLSRSEDGGKTWSKPEPIADRGVWPNACRMKNGVLACTYGRPGNWLAFSLDAGRTWRGHFCFYNGPTTSCNSVQEIEPDTLLVLYDSQRLDESGNLARAMVGTRLTVKRQ